VDVTEVLDAPCGPETLFDWVDDLARYPGWLDIVPRAVPAEPRDGDPGPAWSVDLRGRLGPFARSKRLRMVRTVHDQPRQVRFERLEHDGRQHSSWTLDASVAPGEGTSEGGCWRKRSAGRGPACSRSWRAHRRDMTGAVGATARAA
jgi:hypothetical protein